MHRVIRTVGIAALAAVSMMLPNPPVGALSEPKLLKNINPGGANSTPTWITRFDGAIYFDATEPNKGGELWRTKGTRKSTRRVADVYEGPMGSFPSHLTPVGDLLFFVARDERGFELWKTRGTRSSTKLVKDINPGPDPSNPLDLVNVDGTLFFMADDGDHGFELWKSRGTRRSTKMVEDINPSGDSLFLVKGSPTSNGLTDFDGTLILKANDGSTGFELWKSRGTAANTRRIKNIAPGSQNSTPGQFTPVGDRFFFAAFTMDRGYELYKSRGTRASTRMVEDIAPDEDSAEVNNLTRFDGKLFFAARDETGDSELWKSGGKAPNTKRVKNIDTTGSSFPSDFIRGGDRLFFTADTNATGRELWKTRGTRRSTKLVKNIRPDSASSVPSWLAFIDGILFFSASNGVDGSEVWISDGTRGGTEEIIINPTGTGDPRYFTRLGPRVIFSGNDDTYGYEPRKFNL